MVAGIAAILSLDFVRASRIDVEIGNPSPQRITSPQTKSFVSEYLTASERERAARDVLDVYTPIDRSIGRMQVNRAREVFSFVDVVRADTLATPAEKVSYLQAIETVPVDDVLALTLLDLSGSSLSTIRSQTERIIDQLMRNQIREDQIGLVPQEVSRAISLVSEEQEDVLMAIVPSLIVPNSFFDEAATETARNQAREQVEPFTQSIIKDQVILSQGDIVTAEKYEMLEQLGILQAEVNWWAIGSIVLVSIMSVVLIFLYYLRYRQSHYHRWRYMALMATLVLVFVLSAELMIRQQTLLAYLFPAAALSMLLAVIFDARFSAFVTVIIAGLVGYIANGSLELAFYTVVGSFAAILTLRDAHRINDFFRAGVIAAVGNLIVVAIFNLIASPDPLDMLQIIGLALASGGLSAMLTIAGFYVAGTVFGITTMLQLQELSRFDQPLMQELLHRAPGTYHHSIMVANLSEQAADRIGANSLLVRVGAFYHDIGKMANAPFFTENQEAENPHDDMDPVLSAEYIVGHVTEGLQLARKHRLPERIQDFIAEHHGTQVLGHFYRKARDASAENNLQPVSLVDQALFTYPGPAPRSRETGIVMMADAVEATSKAVQPNNEEAIIKLVRTITDDLMAADQLDDSGLTLGDIQQIRASFVETLKGRFHVRVKYAGNEQLEAANTPAIEAQFDDLAELEALTHSAERETVSP